MNESRWHLSESGDEDLGFQWDLFLDDGGRLNMVASIFDEKFAEQILSAMRWQDALGQGRMSLSMEGIMFDTRTGKARLKPKPKPQKPVKKKTR